MLTRYLEETMAKARYDLVSPGRYVGELAEFGVGQGSALLQDAGSADHT